MIEITVTGDTYPMRGKLKDLHYRWNGASKSWSKVVTESSLDNHCDKLRPLQSYSDIEEPKIIIGLRKVDINGNPFSPDVMKVHLRSMARPGEPSITELFNTEVSVIIVPPIQGLPGPIEPKKEKKNGLEGFF